MDIPIARAVNFACRSKNGAQALALIRLVSPQFHDVVHSQLEHALAEQARARLEPIVMHAQNATARGIADGDLVRVKKSWVSFRILTLASGDMLADVVALPTGAWQPLHADPGCRGRVAGAGGQHHTAMVGVSLI